MVRNKNERGVSIPDFLEQRGNQSRGIELSRAECTQLNFGTLPSGIVVRVERHPLPEMHLSIRRSSSKLAVSIELPSHDADPTRNASTVVMQNALIEAAKLLTGAGRELRGYRQSSRLLMWTSRYQRGDSVLRFVEENFKSILQRAQAILREVATTHHQ